MPACEICEREIGSPACLDRQLSLDGRKFDQVRWGDEVPLLDLPNCPACGVEKGAVHHWVYCDLAQCPICGGQFGGCGHEFEELVPFL